MKSSDIYELHHMNTALSLSGCVRLKQILHVLRTAKGQVPLVIRGGRRRRLIGSLAKFAPQNAQPVGSLKHSSISEAEA